MQVKWHIENQVLYGAVEGKITAETSRQFLLNLLPPLDASVSILHVLLDVQAATDLNITLLEAINDKLIKALHTHPKLGWLVYIGSKDNSFNQFFTTTLAQNHQTRIRWFTSLEDAMEFLSDVDERLTQ